MGDFFAGPYWDVLLVVAGGVLGLVLQRVSFGDPRGPSPPKPLHLSDLPAATPPSLKAQAYAEARAHATAETRVVVVQKPRREEDPSEVWGWLIGALVGAVLLAAAYLEGREEIATGLRALVAVGLGFWLTTFAFLLRRRAIVGFGSTAAVVVAAVVFLLAPAVVSALAEPRYVAGRDYADLLRGFDACGISGLADFDGLRGVTFVLFQLLGVLLYVIGWAAAATLLLVIMGLVAVRFGARPSRLWTRIARVPGPWREHPLEAVLGALVCAVLALAFAGGTAQRALAMIGAPDDGPAISQARARLVDGRIRLYVRSDFAARVTVRVQRSRRTMRAVRRRAVEGVNRWLLSQANGRAWPRWNYRLRLTARDADRRTATPISLNVPGRYPRPSGTDDDRCLE